MTVKNLIKRLANYNGDWDDEVIFENYDFQACKLSTSYSTDKCAKDDYHITTVGYDHKKHLCLLNNAYEDVALKRIVESIKK